MLRKYQYLNVSFIVLVHFSLIYYVQCTEERSFLDNFIQPFRVLRTLGFETLLRSRQLTNNRPLLKQARKVQKRIPNAKDFPCDLSIAKSATVPNSVHKLRPGDIQVIGALGDSLTAGFGLTATNLLGVALEDRGISFSIGGEEDWRTKLTLPNILKEFNPSLVGYSLGPSISTQRESQFNVAEGGAVSNNMPYMSKVLIQRIVADKRVNFPKDWKMVTLMIGSNDFCSEICYYDDPFVALARHKSDLLKTLRTLKMYLPRTIVNVIPPPHLEFLASATSKPFQCQFTHSLECPCLMGLLYKHRANLFNEIMTKWQDIDIEISNSAEFDTNEFTVNVLPFFKNFTFPRTNQNTLDYTYLSQDCFHLSQKGNARLALELWNSILEPVGRKHITAPEPFAKFNCPTNEFPYIFTRRNSQT